MHIDRKLSHGEVREIYYEDGTPISENFESKSDFKNTLIYDGQQDPVPIMVSVGMINGTMFKDTRVDILPGDSILHKVELSTPSNTGEIKVNILVKRANGSVDKIPVEVIDDSSSV